jgi:hypothetical protein
MAKALCARRDGAVVLTFDDVAWPRWAYVPGIDSVADRDTLERVKALVPRIYRGGVPETDPALHYGLALNDAGFFWEAHEILEAIWKVAPQGGRDRILLRACIQVANANLKMKMGKPRAARRLLLDASAELDEVAIRAGRGVGTSFADTYAFDRLKCAIAQQLDHGSSATSRIALTET